MLTDTLDASRPANERKVWQGVLCVSLVIFLMGLGQSARADIAGQVCVENGGVISIGGKRSSGQCVDGRMVKLYGVAAPDLAEECRIGGSEVWRCGLASAAALLQAVRGREVECRGNSNDAEGRLIAICFTAGRSLNQFMVEMGWARADRSVTSMYNEMEDQARATRRGLWSSDFGSNAGQ